MTATAYSLGDSAVVVRVAQNFEENSDAALDAVLQTAEQLKAAEIPSVVDIVPAYTTVAVFFDSPQIGMEERVLAAIGTRRNRQRRTWRTVTIPLCYEGEFAIDLADVARNAGLRPEEVIRRHSSAVYRVACVGFAPGFPYLAGLPRALATPRRSTPRTRVPAGSVGIGGWQTGIYPQESPGGWNVIGRTPLRMFDAKRNPAALLHAGDNVRFRRIGAREFSDLQQ
jgi:inhibitor of KinA